MKVTLDLIQSFNLDVEEGTVVTLGESREGVTEVTFADGTFTYAEADLFNM